jgi:hypothetical protein
MNMNDGEPWMCYMNLLYDMVNIGCGEMAQNSWVFPAMKTNYFPDAASIGTNLIPTNPPDATTLDYMFTDPWYGLQDPLNYFRWNQLKVTAKSNTTEYNNNIAWKSELRSVFNLVWDQMQTVGNNWNNFYKI